MLDTATSNFYEGKRRESILQSMGPICPLALTGHHRSPLVTSAVHLRRDRSSLEESKMHIFIIPLMMPWMGGAGPMASATIFLERLAAMLHDREAPLQLQQCHETLASDCHQRYTD